MSEAAHVDLSRLTNSELAAYLRQVGARKHSVDGAIHLAIARILDDIAERKREVLEQARRGPLMRYPGYK